MKFNLITRVDERDYVLGDGHLALMANVPSSDWTQYFHFREYQKLGGLETDCCVIFTAQEAFDGYIDFLIQSGKVLQTTIDWFTVHGYMDSNSDDKKPHFHTSPIYWSILTGNGQNGNALQDPWVQARAHGAIPWSILPFDTAMTPAQFFKPISQDNLNLGQLFLAAIGGKNSIQYHWVFQNINSTIPLSSLDTARQTAPLCIGINVGPDWNEVQPPAPPVGSSPGHSVANYARLAAGEAIEDHYQPFEKVLVPSYPIPQVLQAVVTITPPPSAPTAPDVSNDTPAEAQQATQTWLSQIIAWLSRIVSSLNGAKVGKETSNIMFDASTLSSFKQSLLDIGIKAGVFLVLLLLNFISTALSNGSVELPYPTLTLPVLTLILSQLDSYFVNYAAKENVPVPTV